ncbi:MAG: DMT family transporter [Bacteroidaceae bacterium]
MQYLGETISLGVAVSWTVTALVAEVASKRIGAQALNVWRMILSLSLLGLTLWVATGSALPLYADATTWMWLLASGLVGYVFGDYCLFNSYVYMGSRWGQLFMMLAPIAAALSAWVLIGETLSLKAILGIVVTLTGISMSVVSHRDKGEEMSVGGSGHHVRAGLKVPLKGVLFGIGAGVGQGVGLVLSKAGMEHYALSIPEGADVVEGFMPFASTMMRAVSGLVGLTIIMYLKGEGWRLLGALRDRRGMVCTLIATVTGPFVGVSLSLMALLYTSAGIAQTLMSLTPILILWPSHVFFGQRITWVEVCGAVISVVGVSLFFV